MKLSEIKVGDKVRLKAGVEDTGEWAAHLEWWHGVIALNRLETAAAYPRPVLTVVCTDGDGDGGGDVCVHGPGGPRPTWFQSRWLEPVEDESPAEPEPEPETFVPIHRKHSAWIDLTTEQIAHVVASFMKVEPKEGTLGCTSLWEEGVYKGVTVRWEEQAPGGDS